MLFRNSKNNPSRNYNGTSRLVFVVVVSFILLVVITLGIYLLEKNYSKNDTNEYLDPYSGETVSDPANRVEERYGSYESRPIFLGLHKITDFGATKYHISAIEEAFYEYSSKRKYDIKEVSVDIKSISVGAFDQKTYTRSINFNILINRTEKYEASVYYDSIRSAKLVLRQGNKIVYESGYIDKQKLDSEQLGD